MRIVFFRTDMLGDTLLNFPALDEMKKAHPDAYIAVVCHPSLVGLFDGYPSVDECIPFEAGRRKAKFRECWDLFKRVRKGRYHVAIVSNARKDFHLITFLAGIRKRIGYGRKWGFLLTHRIPDLKAGAEKHELEYNVDLLRPLGIKDVRPHLYFPLTPNDLSEADRLLMKVGASGREPFVVVHPFSSDIRKCWPLEKFSELMCLLKHHHRFSVLVIGVSEETAAADELVKSIGEGAYSLAGKTTLRSLAAILKKAELFVGHDSGPMHLAAAVGTPTLGLFARFPGGPNPKRWGPWGQRHVVIHEDFEKLESEPVYAELKKLLDIRNEKSHSAKNR